MRDKRTVDELSIEELERILAIRKREERQGKMKRMERAGRVVPSESAKAPTAPDFSAIVQQTQTAPAMPTAAIPVTNGSSGPNPQFEDDAHAAATPYKPQKDNADRFWKAFVNQSLLLVEVAAIGGLIYLGVQMFSATSSLQQETANAQAIADEQRRLTIPTIAPTALLKVDDFILPGGHIFTASGEVRFNYDEVPANLLGLVQSQILQPVLARPVQTAETALEIQIPKINVKQSIVPGMDWEALKLGVGQMLNNVNPGDEQGNLVLSGHNDIYGEVFRHLDELEVGDEFTIRTQTQVYTYRVTGTETVDPTKVSVLQPRGGATVTLISCYPYQVNNKRIIIFADRVGSV